MIMTRTERIVWMSIGATLLGYVMGFIHGWFLS